MPRRLLRELAPSLMADSEMSRRVREFDWAGTALGPIESWPQSLLMAVGICLNSRFPMFVWWGDALINIYNDGYIPMLGARHPAGLGRPARASWEDIWADVGPQAELVMKHGQATWNERVHLRMERNGYPEDTWFTWSYSPIRDDAGGIGGLFCAVYEDTPRVLAERQRDLSETALKEADRRKDEFLAMLAHELRNPLAPLSNALNTVRLGGDAANVREAHEVMDRQVRQLVRLVDDLLDVSRISGGKVTLQKETVPLSEVMDRAVETVRPLVDERGQRLVLDVPGDVWLDADLARLSQVFANILHNASKFTPRRGTLAVEARAEAGRVMVEIRDDGVGIPPEKLGTIFDMFSQVDNAIERSHGGLGLGLAIVKTLVEMHGGSVEATSDGRGKGTSLKVRLPMRGAPETVSTPAPAAQSAGAALRLLVVDDNRDSAESLGMVLEQLGHRVRLEYDGAAAVDAARQFSPDAVFLDIGMPGMSGFEVCRQLRADPRSEGLVVVAQTGWGDEAQRSSSRAAGFDHHLVKPVDLVTLKSLLSGIAQRPR